MEKLVRDRIPEIIAADRGETPAFRIASPGEYPGLLAEKLREEVGEYLESRRPEELADILEVVRALARAAGLAPEEIERIRRKKARERGKFADRKVMDFP
jgi:predicted house-cleaning noncanonical NTP pyrophosphatase (MazG superfamily)